MTFDDIYLNTKIVVDSILKILSFMEMNMSILHCIYKQPGLATYTVLSIVGQIYVTFTNVDDSITEQ